MESATVINNSIRAGIQFPEWRNRMEEESIVVTPAKARQHWLRQAEDGVGTARRRDRKQLMSWAGSDDSRAQAHAAETLGRVPVDAQRHLNYYVVQMPRAHNTILGEFEQVVLLAILRLEDNAYGVTIRKEIRECTGRNVAPGALYNTLDRLEEKGMVESRMGDPSPQRGGRAKRLFTATPQGIEAVAHAQRGYQKLMQRVTLPGVAHA